MSTSPSWFDQEKFSRLVKKVGPKSGPSGPLPAVSATRTSSLRPPEKETRRLQRSLESGGSPAASAENSTPDASLPPPPPLKAPIPPPPDAPIRAPETVGRESDPLGPNFPSPMPVPEPRSVSPLARRTTPLPNLKPIFEYDKPPARLTSQSQPLPNRPALTPPPPAPVEDEAGIASFAPEVENSGSETMSLAQFSEGLSSDLLRKGRAPQEEDKPSEGLQEIDEMLKERDELSKKVADLSKAAEERDAARHEVELLRTQLQQADEIIQATGISGANLEELTRTVEERDSARRDYASLREQFETLKAGGAGASATPARSFPGFGSSPVGEESESLKAQVSGLENMVDVLKKELDAVQGQISQSRDETSVAQRGLALSQRALQETRDALRESSEASSQAKASVESLKNECSSLVQQNLALQSQNDQIERELASVRAKLAARA